MHNCFNLQEKANLNHNEIVLKYILNRIAKIINIDNTKCWQGGGIIELSYTLLVAVQIVKTTFTHWHYLLKLSMHLLCDPVSQLLGIEPRKLSACAPKTCENLFIVA